MESQWKAHKKLCVNNAHADRTEFNSMLFTIFSVIFEQYHSTKSYEIIIIEASSSLYTCIEMAWEKFLISFIQCSLENSFGYKCLIP